MESQIRPRCSHEGCTALCAIYEDKVTSKRYCNIHKEGERKKIKGYTCISDGCERAPIYNIKGGTAKYCGIHRTEGMVNVVTKRCIEDGCDTTASFGIEGKKAEYCGVHNKDGMINLKVKYTALKEDICKSCSITMKLNKMGYCEYCDPMNTHTRCFAKQTALFEYLDARDLSGNQSDSMINSGKYGKERPDRIYNCRDRVIILECDENQHKQYSRDCEVLRMKNISQCFDGIPVYFIRWNPDNYKSVNTIETVGKRHKRVGDLIENIINSKYELPIALCSVLYMYYDNWDNSIQWNIITQYDN
jgi:hypothetical protein